MFICILADKALSKTQNRAMFSSVAVLSQDRFLCVMPRTVISDLRDDKAATPPSFHNTAKHNTVKTNCCFSTLAGSDINCYKCMHS